MSPRKELASRIRIFQKCFEVHLFLSELRGELRQQLGTNDMHFDRRASGENKLGT